MIYPPYCDIVSVTVASLRADLASLAANKFVKIFTDGINGDFSDIKAIVLRPTPTAVPRVNNKYRYRIIIKCKNNKRLRELLNHSIENYNGFPVSKQATLSVDINPDSTN